MKKEKGKLDSFRITTRHFSRKSRRFCARYCHLLPAAWYTKKGLTFSDAIATRDAALGRCCNVHLVLRFWSHRVVHGAVSPWHCGELSLL